MATEWLVATKRFSWRTPLQKGPAEVKERQSPRNRWRHAKGGVAVCRFEICRAARRRAGEPRTVDWGSGERLK